VPGSSVATKFTPMATSFVKLIKSNSSDCPTAVKSLPRTMKLKLGSAGEKRPVASLPPCSLTPGSMPSANPAEHDNPKSIKVRNQREIFTSTLSDPTPVPGTVQTSNLVTNMNDSRKKIAFVFYGLGTPSETRRLLSESVFLISDHEFLNYADSASNRNPNRRRATSLPGHSR
jgi:hypothetical protein